MKIHRSSVVLFTPKDTIESMAGYCYKDVVFICREGLPTVAQQQVIKCTPNSSLIVPEMIIEVSK